MDESSEHVSEAARHDHQDPAGSSAPDLLKRTSVRMFSTGFWIADITYIRCYGGWLYLAIVMDLELSSGMELSGAFSNPQVRVEVRMLRDLFKRLIA